MKFVDQIKLGGDLVVNQYCGSRDSGYAAIISGCLQIYLELQNFMSISRVNLSQDFSLLRLF